MKRLVHNARVLVTDGGRATVFRNIGQPGKPQLEQVRVYGHANPPSREQGSDKPPRVNDPSGRRSTIEPTDYHQQAEDRFVQQIAADMDRDLKAGEYTELVVAAPPLALGVYRKAVSAQVAKVTLMEINKDLTKHPASEVALIVVKTLEGD
ncbi:host attachment protein [Aestuariivirga sp.]|jgi:protein required for attachment to host cells|uniref:baeRF12 domain-containing protein n=1 Tax=Aestuariivirga sp. TaxID=2650926 RepID=UPI0037841E56